jgi:hypothetical protein
MAELLVISPERALKPTESARLVLTDSLRLGCPAPSWCPAYPPTPPPTSAPTGPPTAAPTTAPPVAPTAVPFSDRSISLQVAQLPHTVTSAIRLIRRTISNGFMADLRVRFAEKYNTARRRGCLSDAARLASKKCAEACIYSSNGHCSRGSATASLRSLLHGAKEHLCAAIPIGVGEEILLIVLEP